MIPAVQPPHLPPGLAAVTLARALADELRQLAAAYAGIAAVDSLARLAGCRAATAGREGDRCRAAAALVAVWDAAETVGRMTGLDPLGADLRAQSAGLLDRARVDARQAEGVTLPSPTVLAARILAAAAAETGGVFPSAGDV